MTRSPKEYAIELVDKYYKAPFNCTDCDMPYCDIRCTRLNKSESAICAEIDVKGKLKLCAELRDVFKNYAEEVIFNKKIYYYAEVLKEIQKNN